MTFANAPQNKPRPDTDKAINEAMLNVPMPKTTKRMLHQLSDDCNQSMSAIVRTMIAARHRMQFDNRPACLTGTPCHCPQMHPVRGVDTSSDEQRVERQDAIANPDDYQED